MKNLKNIITTAIFTLILCMSFGASAQESILPLSKELSKVVTDPIKIVITNSTHKSSDIKNSQSGMSDFLTQFNREFKNNIGVSSSRLDAKKKSYDEMVKVAEKNVNYELLMSFVRTSNSIKNIREKIKNQIKVSHNTNEIKALVLFDYQIQIMDSYGALNVENYRNGKTYDASKTNCCEEFWDGVWNVFQGAAAGATLAGAVGGASCTVVVPVVGTVACGVVGALGGAIVGGLYAAFN